MHCVSTNRPIFNPEPKHVVIDAGDLLHVKTQNSEPRTQNSKPRTQNSEPRTQNSELRTQNPELRTQNPELRTQNPEPRTQNSELKHVVIDAGDLLHVRTPNVQ